MHKWTSAVQNNGLIFQLVNFIQLGNFVQFTAVCVCTCLADKTCLKKRLVKAVDMVFKTIPLKYEFEHFGQTGLTQHTHWKYQNGMSWMSYSIVNVF